MKKYFILFIFFAFNISNPQLTFSQVVESYTEQFILQTQDTVVKVSKPFIEFASDIVFLDSLKLIRFLHYNVNYRTGTFYFRKLYTKNKTVDSVVLTIHYRTIAPFSEKEKSLRTLQMMPSDEAQLPTEIKIRENKVDEDIFGPGITKSGSIVRGFTVGTNRELNLTSGFRMQLSGKLSDDVDVTAALTDENTPLQPEGTTQTLREVDKVFIEIKHPQYTATLGDFVYEQNADYVGSFGQIQRKLLGATGSVRTNHNLVGTGYIESQITAGTVRGKYTTNQIQGIEGLQGPYRLLGKNGERFILIIAGSERVYLDGQLLKRGETNDYVIDYSSGEVTFTSKRIITSASRIVIDFEYSDQEYTRNVYAATIQSTVFNNTVKLTTTVRQESDDYDSPLDMELGDNEKAILEKSGASRIAASTYGATNVEKGQYLLKDTIINGNNYPIFIYSPGDTNAFYNVIFQTVDKVPTDSIGYYRVSVGHFKVAGLGAGNYMPLRFIPLPQMHRLVAVKAETDISKRITINTEYALSQLDRNRISTVDSEEKGKALQFGITYTTDTVKIKNKTIGLFQVLYTFNTIDSLFLPSYRYKDVEHTRLWNLLHNEQSNETMNYGKLRYLSNKFESSIEYGLLTKEGKENSWRFAGETIYTDTLLPSVDYKYESIQTHSIENKMDANWIRQKGVTQKQLNYVIPSIEFMIEKRTIVLENSDSLCSGSFQYYELSPKITFPMLGRMALSAELRIRKEDSALTGRFTRAMNSLTQQYDWNLMRWNNITASLSLIMRKNIYTDVFRLRGNTSGDIVMSRFDGNYHHPKRAFETNIYYEYSNQRFARLEKLFLRVPKGNGNYSYLGDLNINGQMDEEEFQPVRFDGDYILTTIAGEQLYPVSDLKTSLRLRLRFSEIFNETKSIVKYLRPFTTDTYLRLEERSSDRNTKNIYLLNINTFLNSKTTLFGVQQVIHDTYLFEGERNFSVRYRINERKGLSQFVTNTERVNYSERSLKISAQLVKEIGNQTELIRKYDKLIPSVESFRQRNIYFEKALTDFSYRPDYSVELGFSFGLARSQNTLQQFSTTADINEQTLRCIYALPYRGQLRTELTREETIIKGTQNYIIPFELTEGKIQGKSYLWTIAFEYEVGNNIQTLIHYQGRKESSANVVHTLRAEVKAYF